MKNKKLETLKKREGGGCYSNGSQQVALGPIGPSWRHPNQFFTLFFWVQSDLGPQVKGGGGDGGVHGRGFI